MLLLNVELKLLLNKLTVFLGWALTTLVLCCFQIACAQEDVSPSYANPMFSFFASKGIDLNNIKSLQLYEEIYQWLNTRYKYGTQSETSTDCSGFVRNIYRRVFGQKVDHSSRSIFSVCSPVNEEADLQEGDLLFFKIRKGVISHVAIFLQNGKFAHAAVHGGVRIDSLSAPYYRRTFFKGGRLPVFTTEE